ncbi:FadR/GntR family transcriptional regulator [Hyalangium sp.]|uniref:FadR/GntR family transcriptional regulator n=1 Tax=Hyalangium sp. TaxID=2028555 RepID=UPI002D6A2CF0|nr:GntR family transcriptional regulator [Hyalangium sp.]HYH96976.1 GntR family transcriptional regulator [Hyalangium sp.]
MERMGLVARVAEELERVISQGQLPEDGLLPSEQTLARRYGVSRATVREALLRLATRGLVVQHPGRRSRALALDESVTLENLGVALHGQGPALPERRRLLEGYFALKREVTVELLVACCESAPETALDQLRDSCFALRDAARWQEEPSLWAKLEFELLRLAARAADRPGHALLIQSLERSFRGMAGWVLPHLDSKAIHQWALCAFHALGERDTPVLRRELSALLQVADERLLRRLAPVPKTDDLPEVPPPAVEPLREQASNPESEGSELPDAASPNLSGCLTGLLEVPPAAGSLPEPPCSDFRPAPDPMMTGVGALPSPAETHEPAAGSSAPRAHDPSPAGAGAGPPEHLGYPGS